MAVKTQSVYLYIHIVDVAIGAIQRTCTTGSLAQLSSHRSVPYWNRKRNTLSRCEEWRPPSQFKRWPLLSPLPSAPYSSVLFEEAMSAAEEAGLQTATPALAPPTATPQLQRHPMDLNGLRDDPRSLLCLPDIKASFPGFDDTYGYFKRGDAIFCLHVEQLGAPFVHQAIDGMFGLCGQQRD